MKPANGGSFSRREKVRMRGEHTAAINESMNGYEWL
jgi:hypothetical protein